MPDRSIVAPTPLPAAPDGWFEYEYAALMDGNLALLRADVDILAAYRAWRARIRRGETVAGPRFRDARARLSIFDGIREGDSIELPLGSNPIVDRLADGRWLVAERRAATGDHNGQFYDARGRPAGKIVLGDAIQHLCCAPDGTFWVGYFDEGVFAGNRKVEEPISAAGIAHFDGDGRVMWRFNEVDPARMFVADCYAMSLAGNDLWSCCYMDFPIVRIAGHQMTSWSNRVSGAQAIAVEGDHVLLAGDYDTRDRLALLRLEAKRARLIGHVKLAGAPPGEAFLAAGRDATLHLVAEGLWWRVSVGDVRARLQA